MIVEDTDDSRLMLRTLLEMNGFEVTEADNGYQAVMRAVREHPDVILMDIAMPIMDGIQATEAIRQHEELDDVPIVALTAFGDFYEDRARDAGCNAVIHKPFDPDRIGTLVNEFIH